MSAYVARLLDWHAEAKRQSPLLEMPGQVPACLLHAMERCGERKT